MDTKQTHTAYPINPNTPRGASFPAWLSARFNVPPATARLIAQHAGYRVFEELAPVYPAVIDVAAKAINTMGAAHG